MRERTPLIIWVYLTREDLKQIRYGKVVSRKVGTIADLLPLKIHICKHEHAAKKEEGEP